MNDSDLNATELRKRYHRGGILKDDELSAQQLRARHGIPSNRPIDSRDDANSSSSNMKMFIVGGIIVLLIIIFGTLYLKSPG